MTREEHLAWCKKRAIEEIDYSGDPKDGLISMMSDLGKHADTQGHAGIMLCTMMMLSGQLKTRQEAVNFINGFN